MYDELLAGHTIMRRGAALAVRALGAPAETGRAPAKAQVALGRRLTEFVHHHHQSEDDLFWPVLREAFPDQRKVLDELTAQHDDLDSALRDLDGALDDLDAARRRHAGSEELAGARSRALAAATTIDDELSEHLDAEEPVLEQMFRGLQDNTIRRLRAAIIAGAPRSGPDLVIGLLLDPTPAPGHEAMLADLPAPIRGLTPVFRWRHRTRLRALGQGA